MKIILKFLLVALIMWPLYAQSQEPPPPATQGKVQPGELNSETSAKSDIKTKAGNNIPRNSIPQTNKTDTPEKGNATENGSKPTNNSQLSTVHDDPITRYTFWLMVFTGLLFVCNVFLWLCTKKAADAAQKAADALPTIERAYLFIEVGKPEHVDRNTFNIPIKASNFGKTPAVVIKYDAAYVWGERCPSTFPHLKGQLPDGVSVVASGEWNGVKITTGDIPPDVLGKIGRGEIKSFCCGRVEYHDVWKIRHETGFCWEVNPAEGSFALSDSPLNNYT